MPYRIVLPLVILFLVACKKEPDDHPNNDAIIIDSLFINGIYVPDDGSLDNVKGVYVELNALFHQPVDTTLFNKEKFFITGGIDTNYFSRFSDDRRQLTLILRDLEHLASYRVLLDQGSNLGGFIHDGYSVIFHTALDSTPKFPIITNDSLLTLVQRKTFDYFWDHGHPVSGLARDRKGGGNIVTSGGSGFGMMAILTGIERGFISRKEGFDRLNTMVNFLLSPSATKFHGAFPHWLDGATGAAIAFSMKDNGGDLVETAFLMQGLLTVRQYFKNGSAEESALCDSITRLWENVEWDWYRRDGENRLYWHWSPDYNWEMNMPVTGWNEAMIVYILAAASPVHSIPRIVYDEGWARNGYIINGRSYYNTVLPLGQDYGGPLFFAHYSFLGLDPRNLSDPYAGYMEQNTAHARINFDYCVENPRNYQGYSNSIWGLTASDIPNGYSASSPTNDLGVVAPTAAVSSIPYLPAESMEAIKFFYYVLGDKLWGEYGFYDAFSIEERWFASSYLAIDQGPIICMIENYRTGLLWELFMKDTDVQNGLDKLGFTY